MARTQHNYDFVGPSAEQLANQSPGAPSIVTPVAGVSMTVEVENANLDELDDAMRDYGFVRNDE